MPVNKTDKSLGTVRGRRVCTERTECKELSEGKEIVHNILNSLPRRVPQAVRYAMC